MPARSECAGTAFPDWRCARRQAMIGQMPTIVRSSRPTCPACGFAVFNRRCATCEKCHAELPPSIAYTAAEIDVLRARETVDDQARELRQSRARARLERKRRQPGAVGLDDLVEGGLSLGDLLDLGDS